VVSSGTTVDTSPTLQYYTYDTGYFTATASTVYTITHNLDIAFGDLQINFLFKVTDTTPNQYDFGDIIRLNSAVYPLGSTGNTSYGVSAYTISSQNENNEFKIYAQARVQYTEDPAQSANMTLSWPAGQLRILVMGTKYV